MSDVTGPISTLPGARHDVPDGMMCDEHPDRPAVVRIQGETDSMGCEMFDMCKECLAAYRDEEPPTGRCDWCREEAVLTTTRDYEEGLCGPVYHVCKPCKKRQQDRLNAEMDQWDDDYD